MSLIVFKRKEKLLSDVKIKKRKIVNKDNQKVNTKLKLCYTIKSIGGFLRFDLLKGNWVKLKIKASLL